MNLKHTYLALALGAGLAHAGIASTLILDDFDSDPNNDAGGPGDYSSVVFNNPFNQGSSFMLETGLDTGSDVGAVVLNSGIGVELGGSVTYSNNGAGLNFDGVASAVDSFELEFAMVDQQFQANIVLTTYDNMGNAIGDARWAVLVSAGVDVVATWSFADFIIINDDFDATNIDEITMNLNLEEGAVASLDFIATEFRAVVPPPGSAALLGLGGLMIARRGRE